MMNGHPVLQSYHHLSFAKLSRHTQRKGRIWALINSKLNEAEKFYWTNVNLKGVRLTLKGYPIAWDAAAQAPDDIRW